MSRFTNISDLLPMDDVEEQRLLSGALGASHTHFRSTGIADARLTCFKAMLQAWFRDETDQSVTIETDLLSPAAVSADVHERLCELDGLCEPNLDATAPRRQFGTILQLYSRGGSSSHHQALSIASNVAEERSVNLRQQLEKTFATRPHTMTHVVEEVREGLENLKFPQTKRSAITRIKNCLRGLEAVQTGRARVSRDDVPKVIADFLQTLQTAEHESVKALSKELASEAIRKVIGSLSRFLDEKAASGVEFDKRIRKFREHLQQQRNQAAELKEVRATSVVVPIDGAEESQVLSGILSRADCRDMDELGVFLRDQFESLLRSNAGELCPWIDATNASLADFVLEIDPRVLAEQFSRLIDESVGEGQTLYNSIDKAGVQPIAQMLYDRADHTCHLGDWAQERFNVPAIDLTIVRLPQPTGHNDYRVYKELESEFEKLSLCMVRRGSKSDRAVTVVRVKVGFPIGIEQAGWPFRQGYVKSGEQGHLPHLLDVLPESHDGQVIESYQTSETFDFTSSFPETNHDHS